VSPAPSITHASAGTDTFAPTAAITPSRTTIVPRSITGPETGTMRAPEIAKFGGSVGHVGCSCAAAGAANASVAAAVASHAAVRPRPHRPDRGRRSMIDLDMTNPSLEG